MNGDLGPPKTWLLRHGSTDWSESGRHTGRTDLPLTVNGAEQAFGLRSRLGGRQFARVLVSPLTRAIETCRLAGYGGQAEVDADLAEWDYGDYEGLTLAEIRRQDPAWTIWSGRCPNGETIDQVAGRADRVIEQVCRTDGDVALFAHGHILRVLAARWCKLAPVEGRRFALDTASVSVLGWEHDYPTIHHWNSR